jgi:hypothetical protein
MKDKILEAQFGEELLFADGFDNAIIGIDEFNLRIIYSVKKAIEELEKNNPEWSHIDAIEYFFYNTYSTYIGDNTPIWCMDYFDM